MRHPQFFLDFNPEVLFFVDYEQAEILELHVVGKEAVGADDAVDLTGLDPFDHLARLAGREEPRQHLDPDREAGEPVGERVVGP